MPVAANEELLDALQDQRFSIETPSGGMACPVCLAVIADEDGSDGSCEHLLALGLDSAEDFRSCWTERRPHHFIAQLAREPKDRFLIHEDWVPVETRQSDRGGCSWIGWFAFPASMFLAASTPEEVVQERLRAANARLASLEPDEDEGGDDE